MRNLQIYLKHINKYFYNCLIDVTVSRKKYQNRLLTYQSDFNAFTLLTWKYTLVIFCDSNFTVYILLCESINLAFYNTFIFFSLTLSTQLLNGETRKFCCAILRLYLKNWIPSIVRTNFSILTVSDQMIKKNKTKKNGFIRKNYRKFSIWPPSCSIHTRHHRKMFFFKRLNAFQLLLMFFPVFLIYVFNSFKMQC